MATPPRVLTIAGSDPSGGAGIEADLKVMTAHGCYAMTCITALTAQNTQSVAAIHHVPPPFVAQCLHAVLDDVGVDVVKTGMLASADTIDVVARALDGLHVRVVLDPVMVSTSGSQLLPRAAVSTLIRRLLPLTTVLTPNIPEALLLLEIAHVDADVDPPKSLTTVEDMVMVAQRLQRLGPKTVLLKGGHLPFGGDAVGKKVVDVFYDGKDVHRIESVWIDSKNTHGTGCSLASAIASNLAKSPTAPTIDAVRAACAYVSAAIHSAPISLGRGSGPINHLHSIYSMPFAPGRFVDFLLAHPEIAPVWKEYTHHPFVNAMGDSSLDINAFKYYLVQDYLFLVQFARSNALAAYKSRDIETIAKSAGIVQHVHRELALHTRYCTERFNIPISTVTSTPEHIACTAYTRFVLDVGMSGDFLALQVAMAPCLLGYGAIGARLHREGNPQNNNPYWDWIENYVAEDYTDAVKAGKELLEREVARAGVARVQELVSIFRHATLMEKAFWEMGAGASAGTVIGDGVPLGSMSLQGQQDDIKGGGAVQL